MRLIDADNLKIDMEEKVFCGDGVYKIFGYSAAQVEAAPAITSPPNDPLTIDELREMDGEPVWITDEKGNNGCWVIFGIDRADSETIYIPYATMRLSMYGKTWLAYRCKPESQKDLGGET